MTSILFLGYEVVDRNRLQRLLLFHDTVAVLRVVTRAVVVGAVHQLAHDCVHRLYLRHLFLDRAIDRLYF